MKWWRGVIGQEFRKILAYRSDFWVTFLGQTFVQLFIARALWQSIFESQGVTSLNGYDLPMMTLYYVISPVGTRLIQGESFGFLFREIYEGTFSKYLLYPLSFFQYKSLTYLTNSAFYALQLILMVVLMRIFFFEAPLTAEFMVNLLSGTALFFLAASVYLNLAISIELISLWADNIWSLLVMMRFFMAFMGGGLIPLSFYPEWALKILMMTPFPYLISLPIRTIMGQTSSSEILSGILILAFWWLALKGLATLIWKVGQKRYTGVGQ